MLATFRLSSCCGNNKTSWLQSMTSSEVLPRLISCKSSWHLWDKLHSHFQSIFCAKKKQLRNDLRNISLDNCSISEYLRIQTLIDSLSSIGEFFPGSEHVDIILDGLPDEFESLVALISCRFELLSVDEVETLLAHETRIDQVSQEIACFN